MPISIKKPISPSKNNKPYYYPRCSSPFPPISFQEGSHIPSLYFCFSSANLSKLHCPSLSNAVSTNFVIHHHLSAANAIGGDTGRHGAHQDGRIGDGWSGNGKRGCREDEKCGEYGDENGQFHSEAMVWGWSIEVLDGGSHALDQRVRKSTTLFILYVYELVISCPILKISKPNLGLN